MDYRSLALRRNSREIVPDELNNNNPLEYHANNSRLDQQSYPNDITRNNPLASRAKHLEDQNCYRRSSLSKRTPASAHVDVSIDEADQLDNLLPDSAPQPFDSKHGPIRVVPDSDAVKRNDFLLIDQPDGGETSPTDESERVTWGNKFQFFFTVVAYAVGLGPVWRFPYLCQMYGGGAFLIPYFIMLFIEGIPLFVLELGIGQKMRLGSISVWNKVHPSLGGLGISSAIISFLVGESNAKRSVRSSNKLFLFCVCLVTVCMQRSCYVWFGPATTGVYYIVVISWCLFYVISSFTLELPWQRCPTYAEINYSNSTISNSFSVNGSLLPFDAAQSVDECRMSSPSSYFWYRKALQISDSVDRFESINWPIIACFTVAWLFIFFTMYRGIQSSGRVVYFTVTIPYVVLSIFLVRAVTLRGAGAGVAHMFTPKLHVLLDPLVWLKAATQVFYSLGLGFGSLISYGSYNPLDANVRRDAVAVSLVNCFTSILACVVIFSVLGYKATVAHESCVDDFFNVAVLNPTFNLPLTALVPEQKYETYRLIQENNFTFNGVNFNQSYVNVPVCDLQSELSNTAQGTGLAFIVFADAITKMPWSPFWAVTFFGMLLMLGIGSMIGNLEGVTTPINDLKIHRWLKLWVITAVVCVMSYIIGIVFMTRAGQYWVSVFDDYSGMFSLTIIAFLEMVAISWLYGIDRFFDDIRAMCGVRLGLYWKVALKYVGPVLVLLFLVTSIADLCRTGFLYNRYVRDRAELVADVPYPVSVVVCIMLLIVVGLAPIPLVALMRLCGFHWLENLVANANAGSFYTSRMHATNTATMLVLSDVKENPRLDAENSTAVGKNCENEKRYGRSLPVP